MPLATYALLHYCVRLALVSGLMQFRSILRAFHRMPLQFQIDIVVLLVLLILPT
jgi:hypothetical protein